MRRLLEVLAACLFCITAATPSPGEQNTVERASLFRPGGLAGRFAIPGAGALSPVVTPAAAAALCGIAGPVEPVPVTIALNDAGPALSPATFTAQAPDSGAAFLPTPPAIVETYDLSGVLVGSEKYDPAGRNVPRLLVLAKDGRWQDLVSAVLQVGENPEPLETPAAAEPRKPLTVDHLLSGTIPPSANPAVVDFHVKRLLYWALTPPVLIVTDLKGQWKTTFDTTFDTLEGRIPPPIVQLCLENMTLGELLSVPGFVQRYRGRYHSLIVGYQFYTYYDEGVPSEARIYEGAQRVALVLELIRRADPSARVWLAVGYNSRPTWREWLKTQDSSRFDGVVLFGGAGVRACSHPEVAKIVVDRVRQVAGDKPVALVGLLSPCHNGLMAYKDDRGIIELREIAKRLKASGLAFVSLQEE